MKLISSPASPFVRKVRVLLLETDQAADVEEVVIATTPFQTDTGLKAANPLGKIPALIRDDGPAIYDSRVICRYLDDRAKAGLYPEARLWDVLTLEATADGIIEGTLATVYENRFRDEGMRMQSWMDAQWDKAARALDAVNDRWMSHLNGPVDMAQIAIACALGYADFRVPDRNWRQGRDALAAWYAEFEKRPSMQATIPA
ncbi:glutathione S-transferase [Pseudoprimorskyibacter insulae]|uniref:Putative GST-like protein YibF n=1 Tax=Pseudoprimorskyibacter insulae TaxID=1695997 RepID=A0A2R8AUP3_9RHOB|nr:glutathione S-transferase [Pseudoprimorskyibacter insulae]SPF79758.1 putative GST-like protein YibF [Pseudoprimorskyibacter insulae]